MRLRRGCGGLWLALAALGLDQLTKAAIRRAPGRFDLIPGVLRVHPVRNTGMAFSMLSGHLWLLAGVTGALLVGLLIWLLRHPDESSLLRAGFWLILGGGLGNLIDRLAFGAVTDFLEVTFVRFAVFNVADICVCVGAALAVLGAFQQERRGKGRQHGEV